MGSVVVLGEAARVSGFALAGAAVVVADGDDAVRAACRALPDDVTVLVLTPAAAGALGDGATLRGDVLSVVLPA